MVLLVCILLAAGAMGFTLFVRERDIPPAPVENPELKHLEARRQVLYENLKDLQFEYHQGKLSEEDYQSLKAGFLYDLASVMDSIERLQPAKTPRDKPLPQPAAKAKPKPSQPVVAPASGEDILICGSCGAHNPASNQFCGQCGKSFRPEPRPS